MKILLTVGLVGLLGLQALGLDALLAERACEEGCPADGPDGSCEPSCPDCLCGPGPRGFVPPDPASSPPSVTARAIPREPRPAAPLPLASDIFHVPRQPVA